MGTVVISVDAELGWGFHHLDAPPGERVLAARDAWLELLALFDEFRAPATWAVVGHLLLDRCSDHHTDHPAGERCCEVGSSVAAAEELWYGNGLVDAVRDAGVAHELASHGFTHVHFRHERMSRSFASAELRASLDAAVQRGVRPTSFVFPVNEVAHRDLLATYGFECYRGARPTGGLADRYAPRVGKALAAATNRGTPPIVRPTTDEHGLVNLPASCYLFGLDGPLRRAVEPVHGDPVVARVRRGLDRLAEDEEVLHLWLHPHNLREQRDLDRVRAVLAAVDRARERDGVRVETMHEVASRAKVVR